RPSADRRGIHAEQRAGERSGFARLGRGLAREGGRQVVGALRAARGSRARAAAHGLRVHGRIRVPPNSVDEENALTFYDHTCDVEAPDALVCHLTRPRPQESCVTAIRKHVGRVQTSMRFERLPWSAALAALYRVGAVTSTPAADLAVVPEGLADNR